MRMATIAHHWPIVLMILIRGTCRAVADIFNMISARLALSEAVAVADGIVTRIGRDRDAGVTVVAAAAAAAAAAAVRAGVVATCPGVRRIVAGTKASGARRAAGSVRHTVVAAVLTRDGLRCRRRTHDGFEAVAEELDVAEKQAVLDRMVRMALPWVFACAWTHPAVSSRCVC